MLVADISIMAMKENQIKDFKVILKLFIEIAASSNGSLE